MHQVAFLSALAEESTEKEPILDFGGFGDKTKKIAWIIIIRGRF
jgi:hypothetical protein